MPETSCACAVGHQQRVRRVDDDEILDADGRHQRLLANGRSCCVVSSSIASPCTALPASSWALISHSDDQEPTSLQPTSIGSTAATSVRSMTA